MPRLLAAQVLIEVDTQDAYANLLLPSRLREVRMSARDRAFATSLTYGTLRLQGRYDAIIKLASGREVATLDAPVRACLRLGAHQLLALRIARHAAVGETVTVARTVSHAGGASLVNAVLRKIAGKSEDEWLARLGQITDRDSRLAAVHSHPRQVVGALRQALDARGAGDELEQLLAANNEPPLVSLVARPGLLDASELAAQAQQLLQVDVRFGAMSPWEVQLAGGDPARLPAVRAGYAAVQDAGSQLVAGILANAPITGADSAWLDLCAGPGGKTALLAGLGGPDVHVDANEVAPHRAQLVRKSCRALPNVTVRVGDGLDFPARAGGYDRILVDAPCTGLGSLRRRPEARYRERVQQLPQLTSLQTGLLRRAIALARPGGIIGYATCSPHVAETLHVIARAGAGVSVVDAAAVANQVLPDDLKITPGPYVQLWPHRHGTDAMFLALLRKEEQK